MTQFYQEMIAFKEFSQLTEDRHYTEAPIDWWVVITDVQGSTKAIEAGQYKTVNMVGASSIAAVVNAAGTREIPFVFGGDGATALIPASARERVAQALAQSAEVALAQFGLKLRVGLVPVAELVKAGAPVRVCKYELATNNYLAFFKGQGLTLAETWVKAGQYALTVQTAPQFDPHLGLSCRWAPLENTRGLILSILIKIKPGLNDVLLLSEVIREIDDIVGLSAPESHPIKPDAVHADKMGRAAKLEAVYSRKAFWVTQFTVRLIMFLGILIEKGWLKLKAVDLDGYKKSLRVNSDYRKYDEMLRLVVDCTPAMRDQIAQKLESLHQSGKVYYGLHESSHALMTCFVQNSSDNQHVHFIDGGDGGYAMAARQLKQQMKNEGVAAGQSLGALS